MKPYSKSSSLQFFQYFSYSIRQILQRHNESWGRGMNLNDFYNGRSFDAYEWMGAFVGPGGVTFRTYAPMANGVHLMLYHPGHTEEIEMKPCLDGRFYEVTVPEARNGDLYEYRIFKASGGYQDHADPYGFGMELRPKHCSIVRDLREFPWTDEKWMANRSDETNGPLNIYEMHMGAWRCKPRSAIGTHDAEKPEMPATEDFVEWHRPADGDDVNILEDGVAPQDHWYRYDEVAEMLAPYLNECGYNYVEFMPLAEHPADESWGYQNTGFYAPTSRYGTAEDLMRAVDILHAHGIGAIIDFVPVHFAKDAYSLIEYDGTQLYEYPNSDVSDSEWGTCNFIHSKGEVRSFLESCANYWLDKYHFDGLRMDAISRIIYWMGDENRGVNDRAVDFVKEMNAGLKSLHPTALLCAEDSTNYPNVTKPVDQGGLGYDYKWDMGWMHDTLEYFQAWPNQRTDRYHKITFSMMYFYNEHYLLPYSHDENVHGKATILNKMDGLYEGKFPQARAMYMYMMVHPGKKLNFMGGEFGQMREFDEKREQDWFLRKYPIHDAFYHYICELNHIYLKSPALYAKDYEPDGFHWIDCHQEARCIYAISRTDSQQHIVCVLNFGIEPQKNYTMTFATPPQAKLLLDSDWQRFNGNTPEGETVYHVSGRNLTVDLAPYSGLLFEVSEG